MVDEDGHRNGVYRTGSGNVFCRGRVVMRSPLPKNRSTGFLRLRNDSDGHFDVQGANHNEHRPRFREERDARKVHQSELR